MFIYIKLYKEENFKLIFCAGKLNVVKLVEESSDPVVPICQEIL